MNLTQRVTEGLKTALFTVPMGAIGGVLIESGDHGSAAYFIGAWALSIPFLDASNTIGPNFNETPYFSRLGNAMKDKLVPIAIGTAAGLYGTQELLQYFS